MSQINELDNKTLDKFITKTLEKQMKSYISGKANQALIQKHRKFIFLAHDKIEKKDQSELKKIFGEGVESMGKRKKPSLLQRYKHRLKMNEDGEAPTNAMGSSSSTQGPIQTFDPLLGQKKKKKKDINQEGK